jgi:hypothetical protein
MIQGMPRNRARAALARAAALEASLQGMTRAVARGDLTASPAYRHRLEGALAAVESVLRTEIPVLTQTDRLVYDPGYENDL